MKPASYVVEAAGVEPASENTPLQASTCVFPLKCLSRLGSTRTRNLQRYPAFYFAFRASRLLPKAIPLVDAPINPAGTGWWNGSLFMLLRHMHSRLRLYLKFQPFNEQSETSTCSLSLYIPVESVSPPVWILSWEIICRSCAAGPFHGLTLFSSGIASCHRGFSLCTDQDQALPTPYL